MRALLLLAIALLAGCGSAEEQHAGESRTTKVGSAEESLTFAGANRDRLCLWPSDGRAGLITLAATGEANCTVRGRVESTALVPAGDATCRIPLTRSGKQITLGSPPPSCSYYCGPGASLAGKTFTRIATPEPVTDIAGDPLC